MSRLVGEIIMQPWPQRKNVAPSGRKPGGTKGRRASALFSSKNLLSELISSFRRQKTLLSELISSFRRQKTLLSELISSFRRHMQCYHLDPSGTNTDQ